MGILQDRPKVSQSSFRVHFHACSAHLTSHLLRSSWTDHAFSLPSSLIHWAPCCWDVSDFWLTRAAVKQSEINLSAQLQSALLVVHRLRVKGSAICLSELFLAALGPYDRVWSTNNSADGYKSADLEHSIESVTLAWVYLTRDCSLMQHVCAHSQTAPRICPSSSNAWDSILGCRTWPVSMHEGGVRKGMLCRTSFYQT